jgi:uncharacterized protein involved in type VI secretion and phage assembly
MTERARALDKRYYGVVEAIVVEVEGDPDKEGRVKIKFPWFDDNTVTEWCRVRHLYAGNGYGDFFLPEKDSEVLVSFVHGDMRRPIILGCLYNGKDKPPSERTKSKDEKLIRTKGGHEILLDDSDGKHKVRVKTKDEFTVELSDADKLITIKTPNGNKAEFKDSGNQIKLTTAGGDVIEMGTGTIKVSSKQVTIEANSIQLGGSSATHPVIQGDIFMTLFNTHTHTCAVGPTSPPVPPIIPTAVLSMTTKTS